ncbi:LacI family transcriptional regulator (plasmid) [Deinococcus aetherius]|uniref:LacI family transcriptional regulator n=1 Tax=Deinococcus aetherius TaxID=200252 RepID=A0ABN6RLI9_9DEIO|nr:LacI family DNA-binding transcriptional regulator [Deinococcus aetherius]BDP44185.1 LacI family transcriptional regulator [Deinococcus aetherius]
MPVTQQDVAEAARVSVSTVCLVLRDDPRISERTRRRVLQAAQEVGYVARTAVHVPGATHHLGVLIAESSAHPSADHFFGEVLRGVTEEAEQGGHTVSVAAFDGLDLPRLVREGRAHGLILGGNPIAEGVLERVRALTVPSVFIGRYPGHLALNAVLTDNPGGGQLATEHLLGLGRRRVGFISGDPAESFMNDDRLVGYRRALQWAGAQAGPTWFARGTAMGGVGGGARAVYELLDSGEDFDALLVAEDHMALGALRALRERGVRVPDDVAVVGYSDIHLAGLSDPPLTTVHVPRRRLGRAAARLLGDLLAGRVEPPLHVTVPPKLVVRTSCGAAPQPAHLSRPPPG